MNKNAGLSLLSLMLIASPLSGCSNVKSSLGLEKESPDEFSVITRAPLEMPSGLALPPPNLGVPRPQEQTTIEQAKETVFGTSKAANNTTSSAEAGLLEKAGTQNIEADIRNAVDNETKNLQNRNKPVMKKLLNVTTGDKTPSATVVDAAKELERIQNNKKEGKDITDGKTPVIEE
ncbi:MAG: hypothetical protein COB36_13840 [Alphaproteobacteria bacterium]|nr:MAG: hypothetical protein COB36_13840 [Alphaproteobacteria bacterium]